MPRSLNLPVCWVQRTTLLLGPRWRKRNVLMNPLVGAWLGGTCVVCAAGALALLKLLSWSRFGKESDERHAQEALAAATARAEHAESALADLQQELALVQKERATIAAQVKV